MLPIIISNTWHDVIGVLGICQGAAESYPGYGVINNRIPRTYQSINFEGGSYEIYDSGSDGIGIIMAAGESNKSYTPFTSTEVVVGDLPPYSLTPTINSKYRIRFVATKRLPSGITSIPSLNVMRHGFYSPSNGQAYFGWGAITTSATTINVKSPPCKLVAPGTIKLPLAESRYLDKPGMTTGEAPFTIGLDCGIGDTNINVKYTFTDISDPANTTSTLGLTKGSSTASGLAIQVLEGGTPVSYGPDSSMIGTTNQRDFGTVTASGGQLSKSFIVRYLRTASPLVPGKVNAGMTITMSYQ